MRTFIFLTFCLSLAVGTAVAQTPCDPSTAPDNLNAVLSLSGAVLAWDAAPGSEACRVRVTLPGGTIRTRNIVGFEAAQLVVPASFLADGLYAWQVQCACSTAPPLGTTPYSATETFNWPYSPAETVTDIDGNVYPVVTIGVQKWMGENLRTTRYRNGDPIPTGLSDAAWSADTIGAYAINNDDPALEALYGKLYNFYAVTDPRGLCPAGWHSPTDAEWDMLAANAGGVTAAGGNLKTTGTLQEGTGLWFAPNSGATNATGFSGLPGGYRYADGIYENPTFYGYFWTSTTVAFSLSWGRGIGFNYRSADHYLYFNTLGLSMRCVQD